LSAEDSWDIIQRSRVSFRGEGYPTINKIKTEDGEDWISSWNTYEGECGYWRYSHQAGFTHLFKFREDVCISIEQNVLRHYDALPGGAKPSGFMEISWTLFTITEIFAFAAQLAQLGVLGSTPFISIELNRVQNRLLFAWEWGAGYHNQYYAKRERIRGEWSMHTEELVAQHSSQALNATLWLCAQFQYERVRLPLREMQQKLFRGLV
jgi:hypothetical protein